MGRALSVDAKCRTVEIRLWPMHGRLGAANAKPAFLRSTTLVLLRKPSVNDCVIFTTSHIARLRSIVNIYTLTMIEKIASVGNGNLLVDEGRASEGNELVMDIRSF